MNEGYFEKLTSLGAVVLEFYSLPRFPLGRDSACVGAGAVGTTIGSTAISDAFATKGRFLARYVQKGDLAVEQVL